MAEKYSEAYEDMTATLHVMDALKKDAHAFVEGLSPDVRAAAAVTEVRGRAWLLRWSLAKGAGGRRGSWRRQRPVGCQDRRCCAASSGLQCMAADDARVKAEVVTVKTESKVVWRVWARCTCRTRHGCNSACQRWLLGQ